MEIAVCDIGSNTIKMKIYTCDNGNVNETYSSVAHTKLISYIKSNMLSANGLYLLCDTVKGFFEQAKEKGVDAFYAFATASLRKCRNVQVITDSVFEVCGVKIDVVSGEDEAFFSFQGVKKTMKDFPESCILLDMGGGSTEIVVVENKNRTESHSMNFGSLSLSLDFDNFEKMNEYASSQTNDCVSAIKQTDKAILVGGTAIAISKIYSHYFNTKRDYTMEADMLAELYDILKKDSEVTIKLLTKLVPDRITTVIPGLSAYLGIFQLFGVKSITVSTCGIREGYVYEKILKSTETKQ